MTYLITIDDNVEIIGNNKEIAKDLENKWQYMYHGEGNEWHFTKNKAIEKAEQMKLKRIESLKKQIKKLENMKFE